MKPDLVITCTKENPNHVDTTFIDCFLDYIWSYITHNQSVPVLFEK